ncbi:MAG TPA: hypothetical protein VMU68_07890 [Acidimicrobiales bacterium]|nr:hypothetical protein [Acidimicrobiales bacterium]
MTTPLRSEGWTVQPSFVPNGAVSPVTLLADDNALTQLAGDPAVAWQTPWNELSNVQIMRFARGLALFATASGIRYCWRNPSRSDFDALREIVVAHGGAVAHQRRRAGIIVVAVVVLIAALAGGIGSWLYHNSSGSNEIAATRNVNLTLRDLPNGWFALADPNTSVLAYIFPPSGTVQKPSATPTTLPKKGSPFAVASAVFQRCIGVTAARDRMYGAAGQEPDYQTSSMIFSSPSYGGIEAVSTTQYYRTTTMVQRDTSEITRENFGSCFASSNVALIRAGLNVPSSTINATDFRPATFLRGFSRGGEAELSIPKVLGNPHLVLVMLTGGHFEVTLGVLVDQWPTSESFVSNLSSTLLSRMVSPTSKSV